MMPIHGERYTMRLYACPVCDGQAWGEVPPECPTDGVKMKPQEEGR